MMSEKMSNQDPVRRFYRFIDFKSFTKKISRLETSHKILKAVSAVLIT